MNEWQTFFTKHHTNSLGYYLLYPGSVIILLVVRTLRKIALQNEDLEFMLEELL